jgi:hypothetical protein
LAAWPSRGASAEADRKLKIRLAFCQTTPDVILWPNVGYDYEGRGKQLLAQLAPLCPEAELLPVRVMSKADADKVMAGDKDVDGYLVYVLGMRGGAAPLTEALGKAGRPMVVVEDHYAGPFSLGFNGRAEKAGWKAVCLATSRLQDVADAVRCFQELRKPGAKADDFLAAAKAVYKKNIARMGDMACTADPAPKCDVARCVEQLRAPIIVRVARAAAPADPGLAGIRRQGRHHPAPGTPGGVPEGRPGRGRQAGRPVDPRRREDARGQARRRRKVGRHAPGDAGGNEEVRSQGDHDRLSRRLLQRLAPGVSVPRVRRVQRLCKALNITVTVEA